MRSKELNIQSQVLLHPFSTFGIGGPARFFFEAKSTFDLSQALQRCNRLRIPFLAIGKGSNCLFDDRGFCGMVILNKIDFLTESQPGVFEAGAGYSFSRLGSYAARRGWTGLEFAAGIPGSVGGAVYMNAGAGDHETAGCLQKVTFVSLDGEIHNYLRKNLLFSYRSSPFQQLAGAIAAATFSLTACPQAKRTQSDLLGYRKATQPYGAKSAGCIFRNTPQSSAGALIESTGLKGFRIGDAEVSQQHANFIINRGKATAADVRALIAYVRKQVFYKLGVELQPEVQLICYDPFARS